MSYMPPVETRMHELLETRDSIKCRIPQKVPPNRSRPSYIPRVKTDTLKQKSEANRFAAKNTMRNRTDEPTRPRSANLRAKDECRFGQTSARVPRANIPNLQPKRPPVRNFFTSRNNDRSDQDAIKKYDDLERKSEIDSIKAVHNSEDSIPTESDSILNFKKIWQEKVLQFEKMKQELSHQQNAILELYAVMRNTHQKMEKLGDNAELPSVEELRIMNVTKLTPEQLLRLCSGTGSLAKMNAQDCKISLAIDVKKLHNLPVNLLKACEEILIKRKEIIDWFDSLKSLDKGISISKLSKKINEFNAENEMLRSLLEKLKAEFTNEIDEIVEFLRKGVNDTMALQLRTEQLTYEVSTMNSENTDLRKQLRTVDHLRSQTHKSKFEELQKELKDEKAKRFLLKDRLARSDGQLKLQQEAAGHLESALEQARTQVLTLEVTAQQLREQNINVQTDFDSKLASLNQSIKEHTENLGEISEARKKLEVEKEDLENHLKQIVEHYNESVSNIKRDMNLNVTKLIETEEKCDQLTQDKNKLEQKIEVLNTELLQAELRYKNASNQIIDSESKLEKVLESQKELETTKKELYEAQALIIENKTKIASQNEILSEIERNYKESVELNQSFKNDLIAKEEYITELEKKQLLMEQQLQENESKMESYVEQLTSLKAQITQLQEYFGEFENLNDLHDKVYNQQTQLLEITRQNAELAELLQTKEEELEQLTAHELEREASLERREGIINILTEKEKEQTNIIKILRNNLESRSQADNNVSQQVIDKNLEIETLMIDLDDNKQKMNNLENIILTLQEQSRKTNLQKKKDQDTIAALQNKILEYEAFQLETSRIVNSPAETFDHLIKIIEDELGSTERPRTIKKSQEYVAKHKHSGDRKHSNIEIKDGAYCSKNSGIMMDNLVRKDPTHDKQYDGDNVNRKRPTKQGTQKYKNSIENDPLTIRRSKERTEQAPENFKTGFLTRNVQNISELKEDKRLKMYKLAGHRM